MDAIDEVRMRLIALEARVAAAEATRPGHALSAIDIENVLASYSERLASLQADGVDLKSQLAVTGSQLAMLNHTVFQLANQLAIVVATLGSAIYALKRGDAAASDQALQDALEMQDRLGGMIDGVLGRPK